MFRPIIHTAPIRTPHSFPIALFQTFAKLLTNERIKITGIINTYILDIPQSKVRELGLKFINYFYVINI